MPEVLDKNTLRALGTESRQEIIKLLGKRPHTATEIAKRLDKHVTTISEHLDVLEKSGLIARKDGTNKWVYYALTPKGEKLFKPAYYSWVVIFSISLLFLAIGLSKFMIGIYSSASAGASGMLQEGKALGSEVRDTAGAPLRETPSETSETLKTPSEAPRAPPASESLIGGLFAAAGLGGFAYLLLRKRQVSWER